MHLEFIGPLIVSCGLFTVKIYVATSVYIVAPESLATVASYLMGIYMIT